MCTEIYGKNNPNVSNCQFFVFTYCAVKFYMVSMYNSWQCKISYFAILVATFNLLQSTHNCSILLQNGAFSMSQL